MKLFRIVIAVAFSCACVTMAEAQERVGIVTFTFDDGVPSQYDNAFRIMQEHGLAGTLFVVSGYTDDASHGLQPHSMTWHQVREMHLAGWDIGSHTHTHPSLPELDAMTLFAELTFSRRRIAEEIGIPPFSLASPYGAFDERVLNELRRHYSAHLRAWGGNEGFNALPIQNPYDIGRFEVRSEYSSTEICARMREAGSDGQWLILLFHHVVNHEPEEYQISTEMFTEIVQCAAALQAEGGIQVRTVADVIQTERGEP